MEDASPTTEWTVRLWTAFAYHVAGGDSGKWLNFDQDQMHAGASCELSLPSHSMEPQRKLDTVSIGSHAMNLGGGPVSIFTWGSQCRL